MLKNQKMCNGSVLGSGEDIIHHIYRYTTYSASCREAV